MKSNYVVVLVLMLVFNSYAQDGSLDTSFGGGDGFVSIDSEPNNEFNYEFLQDFTITSSGELILTGNSSDPNGYMYSYITRFLEDGVLDASFGTDGFIFEPEFESRFIEVDVQSNDKLIIRKNASGSQNIIINRLLSDGNIDMSFGDNGEILPVEINEGVYKTEIKEDDAILVFGTKEVNNIFTIFIKRFLPDGELDSSYGNNGQIDFSLESTSSFSSLTSIKLGENDNLLVDYKTNLFDDISIIAEFLPNGNFNGSFGTDGKLQVPVTFTTEGNPARCSSFYVANGKILTGCRKYSSSDPIVRKTVRLTATGDLDETFGDNGILEGVYAVLTQINQRFLSNESYIDLDGGIYPNIKRYYANGTLDTNFQLENNQLLGRMNLAFTESGKLLLFGHGVIYNGPPTYVTIARYNNDVLGVQDQTLNKLIIYPNPSKETFNINFQNLENDLLYQVVDVTGKVIVKGIFTQLENTLKLSQVKTGVYFLQVGGQSYKLIKQ